jgi:O-antigen chain-terminating methyltransferase
VELNPDMVEHCRARGLDVTQGDALACLATLPDGSLDGVFAAQVIEHLQPSELLWLLSLCHDKLAPGGTLVAETNNPLCLTANVTPFLLDLSHVKPIHPQTIEFLLESLGFENIELCFTSPVPDEARLKPVPIPPAMKPAERERWEAVNRSIASLNDLLYGYQDYAVIAKKAYQE